MRAMGKLQLLAGGRRAAAFVAGIAGLSSSIAAAAQDTFNLRCSGTYEFTSLQGKSSEAFDTVYRFDLVRKLYCAAECKDLIPIVDVRQTMLVLQNKETDGVDGFETSITSINRETGRYSSFNSRKNPRRPMDTSFMKGEGTCEPQPFTGFPRPAVKF